MKQQVSIGLVLVALWAQATYLIGRSGTVVKPFQVFFWVNSSYSQTKFAYDWDYRSWREMGEDDRVTTTSAEITAALGLPGRFELGLTLPVISRQLTLPGAISPSGLGDMMVHARWGALPSRLLPVKAALTVGANLPTSSQIPARMVGDRTVDVGAGLALVTTGLGRLVLHGRAGYWWNGRTNDTTKLGNLFEYVAVVDYAVANWLVPEIALSGAITGPKEIGGTAVTRTESRVHNVGLLLLLKPIPQLVVRPKASLPLRSVSSGGRLPPFAVGFDVWATIL